jgi:hypothetical protein
MPVTCPCGCGKSIRRSFKRTAERGVFIASLAQVPERLAEVMQQSDPKSSKRLGELAARGVSYSDGILGTVHGDWWAILPSAQEIGDWESVTMPFMRDAKERDPRWFAQWDGLVRNRVTGKGQG